MVVWRRIWAAIGPKPFHATRHLELGSAWAGNSVNCVPFRKDAVLTRGGLRHAAFFDEAGDVVVIRQALSQGSTERIRLPNDRKPHDAHQSISLGIDSAGRIHLAFGAHSQPLLVTRSRSENLGDGFEEPQERFEKATYPMFLTLADGALALLYRHGRHDAGEIRMEHLAGDGTNWIARPQPLVSGFGEPWSCGPYLNTPVVTDDGTIYLFIVWRMNRQAVPGGGVVNAGIDCVMSRDGLRSLVTTGGANLPETVTPMASERVVTVPLGSSLINQASAGLLREGEPAFLTYWQTGNGVPQYRLGWRTKRGWQVSQVSAFRTEFALRGGGTLPLPHSRPELLVCRDGRAVVLSRSTEHDNRLLATVLNPPDYRLAGARRQILVDEDLGYYEPIVDRGAWRERQELVLYVQHCRQGRGRDGNRDLAAAPARLMSWVLS